MGTILSPKQIRKGAEGFTLRGADLLRRRYDGLGVAVCNLASRDCGVDGRCGDVLWRSHDLGFPAVMKAAVRVYHYVSCQRILAS